MTTSSQTHQIRIANDHEECQEFAAWLRRQGYDASISDDTGSYVDGAWTSESDAAADVMRRLWDEYCADTSAVTAAAVLSESPAQVVARLGDLTQVQVAALLGVAQPSVSAWLSGQSEMSRQVRLLALAHLGVLPTADGGWMSA